MDPIFKMLLALVIRYFWLFDSCFQKQFYIIEKQEKKIQIPSIFRSKKQIQRTITLFRIVFSMFPKNVLKNSFTKHELNKP